MLRVRSSRLTTVKPGLRSYVRASPLAAPQPGATFTCDFFEIDAIIDMDGSPGDSGAGYRAGFTQLQWIETNRAYYRGKMDADGSVDVERDRPPARPAQACRDVATPTDPFTYPPGAQALQGFMPTHPLNIDLATIPVLPGGNHLVACGQPERLLPAAADEQPDRQAELPAMGAAGVPLLHRPDGPPARRDAASVGPLLLERALDR